MKNPVTLVLGLAVASFVVLLTLGIAACSSSSQPDVGTQATAAPPVTSATGRMVINPQFDSTYQFSEGLAAVRIGDDKTGKWGYIPR